MAGERKEQLIKSRKRVRDHGEVFTPEWLVNAMCDLVADECLRPDARFLEPACGDGNFLAVILSRKLAALTARHRRHRADYEAYSFVSVASLYGVDVLADNVVKCRERLLALWQGAYPFSKQTPLYPRLEGAIRAVLDRNILCGDALTLKRADGSPLCFTEWSLVGDRLMTRDYTLAALLATDAPAAPAEDLFGAVSGTPGIATPFDCRSYNHYWELVGNV